MMMFLANKECSTRVSCCASESLQLFDNAVNGVSVTLYFEFLFPFFNSGTGRG